MKSVIEKKKHFIRKKEKILEKKEELISEEEDIIKKETEVTPKLLDIEESRAENFQPAMLRGRSESRKQEYILERKKHIIEEKELLLEQKQKLMSEEDDGIKQETEVKPNLLEDPWQSVVHQDIPEELPDGAEVTCGQGKGPSWSRMGQMIIKILQQCR